MKGILYRLDAIDKKLDKLVEKRTRSRDYGMFTTSIDINATETFLLSLALLEDFCDAHNIPCPDVRVNTPGLAAHPCDKPCIGWVYPDKMDHVVIVDSTRPHVSKPTKLGGATEETA